VSGTDTYTFTAPGGRTITKVLPAGLSDREVRAEFALELSRLGYKNPSAHAVVDRTRDKTPSKLPSKPPQSSESYWRQQLAGQGNLAAGDSGWRDDLAQYLSRLSGIAGMNERSVYRTAQRGLGVADFIPGVGEAAGAADTQESLRKGNWWDATVNGVATALGAFPGLGDAAGGLTKAMFLGPMARNANLGALRKAEAMRAAGTPPEQIWKETGWGWGVDGKPRFEIRDQPMRTDTAAWARTVGEAVHHPELFENYPDLADVRFGWEPGTSAYHRSPSEFGPEAVRLGDDLRREQIPSVLGHELQHAVQHREGFSAGSNDKIAPRIFEGPEIEATDREIGILTDQFWHLSRSGYSSQHSAVRETQAQLERLRNRRQQLAAFEGYRRAAGEVEARNVQTRLDYSDAERRALAPYQTADVPVSEQLRSEWPVGVIGRDGWEAAREALDAQLQKHFSHLQTAPALPRGL
jgi:hypothetical protein